MTTVLFLTVRMKMGYGVDEAVAQVSRQLTDRGHRVVIGCRSSEAGFDDLHIEHVRSDPVQIAALAKRVRASVIVAHTSPFFEVLPELASQWPCWAWEYGDPTPAMFDSDREARQRIKDDKAPIYPQLRGVIAISEFIRSDIDYPAAHVIYCGCDHLPPGLPKTPDELGAATGRPLKVGTLMRLGAGEAKYKGNELFREFAAALKQQSSSAELHVMGRGTAEDAEAFEQAGIRVHLNATDEEKSDYLRSLDVFLSCSLWEGFNLPLAEAETSGTVGLAFDTGAHPEVTPLVMRNVGEAVAQVRAYDRDRNLLAKHSERCLSHVRERFTWRQCALDFERLALGGSKA
ncbi:MAG: glycosyltransferase family 4 protein [Aeromicrobium sp.]